MSNLVQSAPARNNLLPSHLKVLAAQILFMVSVLTAWEYLPKIEFLSELTPLMNSFFISSPSLIVKELWKLFTSSGAESVWPYLWPTVWASLAGLFIGIVLGIVLGLIMGSVPFLNSVFRPFVVAINAIPRIALIPIVVLIFGTSFAASVVISVLVVFFVVFFNAFEGAQSPPEALLQNAILLGATSTQVTTRIRFPYVMVWTLAALPAAATFSVIAVVTGEILTGTAGLGRLISIAQSTADSNLTFAVVVILSVVGLTVVGVAELIKRRVLHWWVGGRT